MFITHCLPTAKTFKIRLKLSKYQIESEDFLIMRIFKANQKQNLVVLMEPSEVAYNLSLKSGNMILNRFCIDEDAAFELFGVNYFKKSSHKINDDFELERKEKGTEYKL